MLDKINRENDLIKDKVEMRMKFEKQDYQDYFVQCSKRRFFIFFILQNGILNIKKNLFKFQKVIIYNYTNKISKDA